MKLNKLTTRTDYNTSITGANVEISYRDALFLYHAFHELREEGTKLNNMIVDMTSNEEPINTLSRIGQIIHSMDNLLLPIASEVVLPKQEIDIYNYISTDDEEPIGKINLKKQHKAEPYL